MQEYRECERLFTIDSNDPNNCTTPLIFADLVASPGGHPAGSVLQSAGAGRGVVWGGCKGQIQYGVEIVLRNSDQSVGICNMPIHVMTALVKLPMNPSDQLTPAYLPNLLEGKSQLSTVARTQSDNVESVLWRREEILNWSDYNMDFGSGGLCWPTDANDAALSSLQGLGTIAWAITLGTANALYGRTPGLGIVRARVNRRLAENEGIYLVREFSLGTPTGIDGGPVLTVQSNAWLHFAIRRS